MPHVLGGIVRRWRMYWLTLRIVTDETQLEGGIGNRGKVVLIGDRVHRPRRTSAAIGEALLLHLEEVGFEGVPRFLGHDDNGRQIVSFVSGVVHTDHRPPWIDDDVENATVLGRIAAFLSELHAATADFVAPADVDPFRPLPLPGKVWNHADVHYGNIVFHGNHPIALIDWDCVAPGDCMYDPSTLLLSAKCPKFSETDCSTRAQAAALAFASVLDGYGASDEERATFHLSIAATFDDVADLCFEPDGLPLHGGDIDIHDRAVKELRWQAEWWRTRSS